MRAIARLLQSPANWAGLATATAVLALQIVGLLELAAVPIAALGYAAGFSVGGLVAGFPRLRGSTWEATLEFGDQGDSRGAMIQALANVRQLLEEDREARIAEPVRGRVLALCDALEGLQAQWERSRGTLSLEESFHARHIATSYLPDALRSYLSIPPQFAATRALADGKTALQTLRDRVVELDTKVHQLSEDLAGQDAQAFLAHSRFLQEKFGGKK